MGISNLYKQFPTEQNNPTMSFLLGQLILNIEFSVHYIIYLAYLC